MPVPVLLDCDPGHDDAIALLLALASPEVELLGVTTVAGNQTLREDDRQRPARAGVRRARGHRGRGGRGPPARAPAGGRPRRARRQRARRARAAAGPGAAVDAHAVDFIAERLRRADRPVTLVPVGPLTNVALLLARHPGVEPRIERIVLMGGAIAEGNVTPAAEFNVWADPEAAARVFGSGLDVTMIGLDVTHRALLTDAHAERLRAAGRTGALVADLHGFYARFHREVYGFDGAPVHDAVAVAHVLAPGLVEARERHVAIECGSELCRGRTVVDLWRRTPAAPNAHVGVDLDADAFLELLLSRLGALDAGVA